MRRMMLKVSAVFLSGFVSLASASAARAAAKNAKVVVAHRGASGYLPEHTLPSAALAHGLGADFVEPDVVLTKDGVPVVLHDIHLEATTDVETRFPERKRADGRWYAIDFTLAEIKSLAVHERADLKQGQVVYPQRFPSAWQAFTVPTLEEEIQLVQGLNKSRGKEVGLYPELKSPAFHTAEGQDIAKVVLALLAKYGYESRDSNVIVQCFDPKTLRYVRNDLKSQLKLVQLIADNSWKESDADYTVMLTEAGIKDIATYADGIGPWLPHVLTIDPKNPKATKPTPLVGFAHKHKLAVHAYTVRADDLPKGVASMEALLGLLFKQAKVDGVFTDFPDRAVTFLKN